MDRRIRVSGDVAYVPLTQGYTAEIDSEDVHLVQGKLWYARVVRRGLVYAVRRERVDGRQITVMMHRVIADTPHGLDTDHVDMNGLNNRKVNLRHATHSQNQHNRVANQLSTSGYKGVTWDRSTGKWMAKIRHQGVSYTLGRYTSAEVAHSVYSKAAAEMHGTFANDGRTATTQKEKAPDR